MLIGQSVLAQKVLVVGHKEKTPRPPMNLRICGVSVKAMLAFALTHLTETSKRTQLTSNIRLDIVVKQDAGGCFGFRSSRRGTALEN